MGGIIGIIACIVAAMKGRKTFAWVIGVWTALAFMIAISGAPQLAIAPGGLFLLIAITMKKVSPNAESSSGQSNVTAPAPLSDSSVDKGFECKNCGLQLTGWYKECPNCHAIDTIRRREPNTILPAEPIVMESGQSAIPNRIEINRAEAVSPIIERSSSAPDVIRFCRYCGQALEPNARFCRHCGARIE